MLIDSEQFDNILALPRHWHGAGSFNRITVEAIARHCSSLKITNSIETGSGKSTLIFSHLSSNHKVFAKDHGESITKVLDSPLLNRKSVEFIEGATQITLPQYNFNCKFQLALIDGPHGYPFADLEYYYIYPHLEEGAILIVDDIQIPSVYNMFRFIEADKMFSLLEVVNQTAFFRRTDAPTFDPYGDGWWQQDYNRVKIADIKYNKKKALRNYLKKITPTLLKNFIPKSIQQTVKINLHGE